MQLGHERNNIALDGNRLFVSIASTWHVCLSEHRASGRASVTFNATVPRALSPGESECRRMQGFPENPLWW